VVAGGAIGSFSDGVGDWDVRWPLPYWSLACALEPACHDPGGFRFAFASAGMLTLVSVIGSMGLPRDAGGTIGGGGRRRRALPRRA